MSQREALLGVSTAEFRDLAVTRCKVQKADQRVCSLALNPLSYLGMSWVGR